MKRFPKIPVFTKRSILDVLQGSEYLGHRNIYTFANFGKQMVTEFITGYNIKFINSLMKS